MSNPVSSYTCRAMRVECPNCPRQGQQAYLSGSARRVLLFLVHLSTGTHHEQLRHATQAFGERTFPFGKPQLAPDFQPFTMRHLSIAGFTMMAPKTGTLCCVAAGKPTGRPLTEPTARCTHLIRRELLVNAIKTTLRTQRAPSVHIPSRLMAARREYRRALCCSSDGCCSNISSANSRRLNERSARPCAVRQKSS